MDMDMDVVDCVICCRPPRLKIWHIGEVGTPTDVLLYAYECSDGVHIFSTSYWHDKTDAAVQWNNMMENVYQGYISDKSFVDDAVFN